MYSTLEFGVLFRTLWEFKPGSSGLTVNRSHGSLGFGRATAALNDPTPAHLVRQLPPTHASGLCHRHLRRELTLSPTPRPIGAYQQLQTPLPEWKWSCSRVMNLPCSSGALTKAQTPSRPSLMLLLDWRWVSEMRPFSRHNTTKTPSI